MNREQFLAWLALEGWVLGRAGKDHWNAKNLNTRRSITACVADYSRQSFHLSCTYAIGSNVDTHHEECDVPEDFIQYLMDHQEEL